MGLYDEFKSCQAQADKIKAKQKNLMRIKGQSSSEGADLPMNDITHLRQKLKTITEQMENGGYGWNGDDAQACTAKLRELYYAVRDISELVYSACDDVYKVLEEERKRYASQAMNAMNSFTSADWGRCMLEYGWNEAGDWVNSLF